MTSLRLRILLIVLCTAAFGSLLDWYFSVSPMATIICALFVIAWILEHLADRVGAAATNYSKQELARELEEES